MTEFMLTAILFRVIWIMISLIICISISNALAYVGIGLVFSYCFCCVQYCESLISNPNSTGMIKGWLTASKIFSWCASIVIVFAIGFTAGIV